LVELQERLRREIIAGRAPETLLLLEHEPVITLGRSADHRNVLVSTEELGRRGIALHRISRGGDVTFHGPGQLVGYPVIRVRNGVVGHLRAMADGLAAVLAQLGIVAEWRREAPGLWVRRGSQLAKICAFGVNVHRRISIHGFALNVRPNLEAFRLIVPCGLPDASITSIEELTGQSPRLETLASSVASAFARSFSLPFFRRSFGSIAAI
jgi:lipoyl(octanoyl) transferase